MGEPTRHEELRGTRVPPDLEGVTCEHPIEAKELYKKGKKCLKMAKKGPKGPPVCTGGPFRAFWGIFEGFLAFFGAPTPEICQNERERRAYEKRPQTQRSEPLRERKSIIKPSLAYGHARRE